MQTAIRLAAAAFLCLSLTTLASGQDVAAKADQYLTTWAQQGRFSGVVLIAKGDKVLLRKAYGKANFELNVPNTPETVFRIGSITKMFTAFSVLQLEEKGLLKVSDPVAQYIPELPAAWSAITIHQLLCHKSGIPDFINSKAYADFADSRHVENALKDYAGKPLLNAPGETLRYSNAGYILLGRIIEKVTGKTYEDYLNENILRPAGMAHTAYDHADELVPNRAEGYRFDGEDVINAAYGDPAFPGSAGALRSTVDDMFRFARVLGTGKLFSPALLAKASTPYGHWAAPPPFPLEADYGYGSMLGNDFGHRYIGHGGWVNGFVSDFKRYPDDDIVMIVLWNFETSTQIMNSRDLAAIIFGQPYEAPKLRTIVHPAAATLGKYLGNYQLGPISLKITEAKGKLYAMGTGQPNPYGLIAVSDTEFYCNDSPVILRFVADDKGAVNQVMLKIGDREMPAGRVTAQ